MPKSKDLDLRDVRGRWIQHPAKIGDHEWSQFQRGEQDAQRSEQPQKEEDNEKK